MSRVCQLAIALLREHPARVLLTSIATAASACLVLWFASGYDALLKSFDVWASVALGHYELSIAPIESDEDSQVSPQVLDAMRSDPAVAEAVPMWVRKTVVRGNAQPNDPKDQLTDGPPKNGPGGPPNLRSEYTVLSSDAPTPPFEIEGRWINPKRPGAMEAVVRADTAEQLHLKLGDVVTITGQDEKKFELKVIGILQAPTLNAGVYAVPNMLTPGTGDVFITSQLGERIFGEAASISFVGIALRSGTDITKWRFGWAPKLSRFETPVQFQESIEIEEKLDESAAADNVRLQSYAATGIGLLVAMLVIFSTINMGVTERVRQLAVLRAVAFTRFQVCRLIYIQTLLLATIGFVVGLGLGSILLSVTAARSTRLLHHGTMIGPNSLLLAAIATFGGAILAAAVPAWRATRVRPVDAMSPRPESTAAMALPIPAIILGLALIAVNPLITFVFPPASESQAYLRLGVGFLSMAIGFVLIAPVVVAIVDRVLGPILARLLVIDPKLLASQITTHFWRSAAAAISMAVGLGLFIGIQVWGFTMLDAFLVGPWAPDAILAFPSSGLPNQSVDQITQIEGVDESQCLPIVVEQPRLLHDITGSAERASVTRQDNVVIVGIDAVGGFVGENSLFEFEWVAGSPQEAAKLMTNSRACIVPDHFLTETGLQIGDGFQLVPPEDSSKVVRYTIAGAVRIPGWHWQTKLTGFRSRTHRAAALVFANYDFVATDFDLPNVTHVWFSYDTPVAEADHIEAAAHRVYQNERKDLPSEIADSSSEPKTRIMPVEEIRNMTRTNAARWIWGISQLPLGAVMIAGIGVLNVILASVRARQWELGVIRSIGITRGELARTILAEGGLIGLTACLLSLPFGVMAGWCGCGAAQHISFFGGLHPPLNIPWNAVMIGLAGTVTTAALAAVWPAVSIGYRRPLELLQQGQSTF